MTWKTYRKTAIAEMRPYVQGESLDGVSITPGVVPRVGGMIARDVNNHADQWYVAPEFFNVNYEEAR